MAKVADVSVQTVSNVTRGRFDLMGKDTRARVEAAMEKLGYYPNLTARGLKQARTRTLGFLVLDEAPSFMADPLTALLVAGVSDVARDSDYEVLIRAERPFEGGEGLIKPLREGRVDGAAVVLSGDPALRAAYLDRLKAARSPFVIFDEVVSDPSVLSVRTAERESSRALTEHLLKSGHRDIAFVAARVPWAVIEQRYLGHKDALEAAEIEPNPRFHLFEATWQSEGGRLMAEKLMTLQKRPTAIMCGSDVLAAGAISALRKRGLKVPDDVAVTGFDDFEFSAYTDPPLTTVRIPAYVMGRIASSTLISVLDGEEPDARQVVLDNELVIRSSA
ncbi:MAG: LacI family DNA-binding transcriptional regulator [Solirubrobacterales bacterium]